MRNEHLTYLLKLAGLPESLADNAAITGPELLLPTQYNFIAPGAASIAATALAAAELWRLKTGRSQQVKLDTYATAAAYRSPRYLRINGKKVAEDGSNITGFYRLEDGRWMYLHCNFPNVRNGNLKALGCAFDRDAVTKAIAQREGHELEAAMFANGGCGGLVRNEAEWEQEAHQKPAASIPLFEVVQIGDAPVQPLPKGNRPLSGVRMLDLTRVLAGPACAKAFAEHGADVIRITRKDLPDLGPPSDVDTGIGKLQAHIDMRDPADAARMQALVKDCDVFLQGYRPGSLAARGLSPEALAKARPGIIYTQLSAWGHEGPWAGKRGYDTVVQSFNGMAWRPNDEKPAFLPGSPHDYLAGYLLAFGTMVALHRRATIGGSWMVRTSLAGTGEWFRKLPRFTPEQYNNLPGELPDDVLKRLLMSHESPWGHVTHLAPAAQLSETPGRWARPAVPRGSQIAAWPGR